MLPARHQQCHVLQFALQFWRHECPTDRTHEGAIKRKPSLKNIYVKELLKARIIAEAMTKSAISAAEDAGASDAVVGRVAGANEDTFLIAAINGTVDAALGNIINENILDDSLA